MAHYFTTNELINSVKRRISIPTNQSSYTDQDIIDFANEELSLNLVPSIMSLHEDYLLFTQDVALEDNQSQYTVPNRAVGNKLRELQFIDQNGNAYEMTRISVGDIPDYQGAFTQNHAYTYYLQHNRVHILPPIEGSVSGSLRYFFYLRPSELVTEDRAAIITDINTSTGEISVNKIPDHFSLTTEYDMYSANSPHRQLKINITPTAVNSTTKTITFATSDIPDQLQVGDHIAQAEECIIPQVPSDLHIVLAQYVAERVLEAQGDTEGLRNAKVKSREMTNSAGNIIDNRVEESPIKLVNRNGVLRFGLHSKKYRRRN